MIQLADRLNDLFLAISKTITYCTKTESKPTKRPEHWHVFTSKNDPGAQSTMVSWAGNCEIWNSQIKCKLEKTTDVKER